MEQDIEEFEISTLYSYQFGLEDLKKPYSRKVSAISGLSDLGLSPEEVRSGNEMLIARAGAITGGRISDWGTGLIFLMDYAGAKARLSALMKIYDRINDKSAADNYIRSLQAAKEDLVMRYAK